ncbi:MAG TPA: hypothetical protein VFZ35_06290 [Sphingomicrobium sp.]
MPRGLALLVIVVILLVGGLVLLSNNASEVPTETIEVDVAAPANAG